MAFNSVLRPVQKVTFISIIQMTEVIFLKVSKPGVWCQISRRRNLLLYNVQPVSRALCWPCSIFTHILSAFIEHPTTKAVLVVHTKAGACSSLWAQDQHKNVSFHYPSHLFIPAFLTKVFSLIKKRIFNNRNLFAVKLSVPWSSQ